MILCGIVILAWGFNALLATNRIVTGGLPGLSLLLNMLWNVDPSISQWLIGIPIFGIGWICLGKRQILNSLAGACLLPLAILITKDVFPLWVESPILASLFGGFTCGIGLGLVFRANATTGGFSILARIIAGRMGMPISRIILAFDAVIVLATGALIGVEAAMLAILSVIALSKAIDIVQTGVTSAKSLTIITERHDAIRELLLHHLDCGATELDADGSYSGTSKTVFLTVVPLSKVGRLRRNIRQVDPEAFTIVSDASEVLGYGFQNHG